MLFPFRTQLLLLENTISISRSLRVIYILVVGFLTVVNTIWPDSKPINS